MTSTNRLLDVVDVFAGDHRVELTFAVDRGSAFSHGADSRVRAAGYVPVPLDQILPSGFDLALTASDKSDLGGVDAPLVLLPHGAGYHRYTGPATISGDRAVSGLAMSALRDHHRFPTIVGLAHSAQRHRLRDVSATAARRARVVGDPCLDRLVAGLPLREAYREAFGTTSETFVVVNSTWGPNSLFGTDPRLVSRLLAELPVDTHRVALVLHPNVWAWHGAGQVNAWLSEAREAGLILIPPEEGWRAAVIAADAVITDHGSVTCYAAALGLPVAMAADGDEEVVTGSAMDVLRKDLPHIRRQDLLLPQLDALLSDHRSELTRLLTSTIFDRDEPAIDRMRQLVYSLLDLTPQHRHGVPRPLPVPRLEIGTADAHAVRATVSGNDVHDVRLDRFAAVLHDRWLEAEHDHFLVIHDDQHDLRLRESAAVIVARATAGSVVEARDRAADLRARFPGARTTACRSGSAVAVLTGSDMHTVAFHPAVGGGMGQLDDLGVATAVHALARSGQALSSAKPTSVTVGRSTVHLISV